MFLQSTILTTPDSESTWFCSSWFVMYFNSKILVCTLELWSFCVADKWPFHKVAESGEVKACNGAVCECYIIKTFFPQIAGSY